MPGFIKQSDERTRFVTCCSSDNCNEKLNVTQVNDLLARNVTFQIVNSFNEKFNSSQVNDLLGKNVTIQLTSNSRHLKSVSLSVYVLLIVLFNGF